MPLFHSLLVYQKLYEGAWKDPLDDFGLTVWKVWKHMNQFAFNNEPANPEVVVRTARCWGRNIKDMDQKQGVIGSMSRNISIWDAPLIQMVLETSTLVGHVQLVLFEMNVADGFLVMVVGQCRNWASRVLLLWAIYDGLMLLWSIGWRYVIVNSDCPLAVQACNGALKDNSNRALVSRINEPCNRPCRIVISHIPRDQIWWPMSWRDWCITTPLGLHQFETSPKEVDCYIQQDLNSKRYCFVIWNKFFT